MLSWPHAGPRSKLSPTVTRQTTAEWRPTWTIGAGERLWTWQERAEGLPSTSHQWLWRWTLLNTWDLAGLVSTSLDASETGSFTPAPSRVSAPGGLSVLSLSVWRVSAPGRHQAGLQQKHSLLPVAFRPAFPTACRLKGPFTPAIFGDV